MLKIKQITIENFRGVKLPLTIEFMKGGNYTSALLYGRNGTGKSSIVDAWEWLNTFQIQTLSREGVSATDFPHKVSKGNNSYISIDFQHPTIGTIKALFNGKKISAPTITGKYDEFRALSTYPNYLRYSDLQEFVYKTKAERYKYIAKFFGLEKFSLLQDTLQTAINKQTQNLQNHQFHLDANIKEIKTITGFTKVDEKAVVKYISSIGEKHGFTAVTQFKDANTIKLGLEKIVAANPITKELTEWQGFKKKQDQFYPLSSVKAQCLELEKAFADLKKNEESIKQLILSHLYELSIEVLPKLEDKTKCPVCDTIFKGDLLEHIKAKHTKLDILNRKKKDFDAKKAALEKQVGNLSRQIAIIQSENNPKVLDAHKSFFAEINSIGASLPAIAATLKKQLKELSEIKISSDTAIEKIEDIIAGEATNRKKVSDKIDTLSKDEKTKTLAQDFHNVSTVITGYRNFIINSNKVSYLSSITTNLNSLFSQLTTFIQTTIQTTFDGISSNVVEYFNVLESSNDFIKNPALKLITGKDKAVELEIEFVTEKISPAFKFMSESQVNSFGLAIFLAAVKHFNADFKFFILDDVINSFDAFKRPKVAQLLATKFSDFQILVFTHDQIFFDTMQRDFPNWQRYKVTSWDYNTGPRYRLAKNYTEEIKEYLDEDKPVTAGQTLGRYLEWTLGAINENMQTPIKYKIENVYTLGEFYDPMVKRFREKLKQSGKQHKLIAAFDGIEQGTIFRNYCAHWKNEASPFTAPEIQGVFDKWVEIEKMLYCPDCKSFANFDSSTGTEYIKCNCCKLDLKDSSLYI
jgi:recombinational DNA repair ATPase RecF